MRINKKELLQIVTENAYFAKRAELENKDVEAKKESFNKWVEVAEARKRISAEELQEAINLGFKTAEAEFKRNNVEAEEINQEEQPIDVEKAVSEVVEKSMHAGQVQLQGIGWHDGIPAKDLKVGDELVWNYGYKSKILGMMPSKTGKTITFEELCEDGKKYTRRMNASRLVVRA